MDLYKTGLIPMGRIEGPGSIQDHPAPANEALIIAIAGGLDDNLRSRIAAMLAACGLESGKTTIITAEEAVSIRFTHLRQTPGLRYIFLFGIAPRALGINAHIPTDSLQSFGGVTLLVTAPAAVLFSDTTYRSALWNNVLRPHFKPDA